MENFTIEKLKERKLRGIKQVFNMILDIFDFSKEKFGLCFIGEDNERSIIRRIG